METSQIKLDNSIGQAVLNSSGVNLFVGNSAVYTTSNPPSPVAAGLGDVLAVSNDGSNNDITDINLIETANIETANISLGAYPQSYIIIQNDLNLEGNNILDVANLVYDNSFNAFSNTVSSDLSGIAIEINNLESDVSGLAYIIGLDSSQIAMCSSLIFELMYDFSSILPNVYETIANFNAFTASQMVIDASQNMAISQLQTNSSGTANEINILYSDVSNIYLDLSNLQAQINSIESSGLAYVLDSSYNAFTSSQTYINNLLSSDLSNVAIYINGLDASVNALTSSYNAYTSSNNVNITTIYSDLSNVSIYINGLDASVNSLTSSYDAYTSSQTFLNSTFTSSNYVSSNFLNTQISTPQYINSNVIFTQAIIEEGILEIANTGEFVLSNTNANFSNQQPILTVNGNSAPSGAVVCNTNQLTYDVVANTLYTGGVMSSGFLNVDSSAQILDLLTVGALTCSGALIVDNGITASGGMTLYGGATIYNGLTVDNHTVIITLTAATVTSSGFLNVDSSAQVLDILTVGALTCSGQITVDGGITGSGGITMYGGATIHQGVVFTGGLSGTGGVVCSGSSVLNSLTVSGTITASSINYQGSELSTQLTSSAYLSETYTSSSYIANKAFTSSAYVNNNYLPLTGGEITNNLTVNGTMQVGLYGAMSIETIAVGNPSPLLWCDLSNIVRGAQNQIGFDFSANNLVIDNIPVLNSNQLTINTISSSGITNTNMIASQYFSSTDPDLNTNYGLLLQNYTSYNGYPIMLVDMTGLGTGSAPQFKSEATNNCACMEFIQLNGAQPSMTGYNSGNGMNANFYQGYNQFLGFDTNNAIMQVKNTSGIAIQNIVGGYQRYVNNLSASSYTINGTEDILTFSSTCTVTLTDPSTVPQGRIYTFVNLTASNVLTITPTANNINGLSSYVMTGSSYQHITIACISGTDWITV